MLTSTQVHQLTVAMYGAAAGAYTAELQAFESETALANFLADYTIGAAKFEDATTDLAVARIIATDFGLGDNDEAVQAVIDMLEAGDSIGQCYVNAIAYLTGDSVAADFEAAAADFVANVAGAVSFTEANPEETDVDALTAGVDQSAAQLDLVAALEALAAAEEAEADKGDEIDDAVVAAFANEDVAAETVLRTEDEDATEDDATGDDIAAALLTTAAAAGVNSAETDAQQDADIEAQRETLASDIADAEEAVADATDALETGVAALMDAVADAADDLAAALDASDVEEADLANAFDATEAVADFDAGDYFDYQFNYFADMWDDSEGSYLTVYEDADDDGVLEFDADNVVYDADLDAYVIGAGTTSVDAEYLDALLAAAQDAYDAANAVSDAEDDMDDAMDAAWIAQEGGESLLWDAYGYGGEDTPDGWEIGYGFDSTELDDYQGATETLAGLESDSADFEEAVDAYQAVKAIADAYDALVEEAGDLADATVDAQAAIENATDDADAPGLGIMLGDWESDADTDEDEVFLYSEAVADMTEIDDFGVDTADQIYVGSEYALVALAEDAVLGEESTGDAEALEIFWTETDDGLVLYVENEAFAGNSTQGTEGLTMITLLGVEAADIALNNGLISETIA